MDILGHRRQQNPSRRRGTRVLALGFALAVLVGPFGAPMISVSSAQAQDVETTAEAQPTAADEQPTAVDSAPPATEPEPDAVEPTAPQEPAPPEEPVTDAQQEPSLPPEAPVEESEEPAVEAPSDQAAIEEPAAASQPEEPPAAQPEIPNSHLSYTPAEQPVCIPRDSLPEIVAHGAALDYDCTFEVVLAAEQVAPAAVQLAWAVRAAVDGGWAVQLLSPVVDPNVVPEWTSESNVIDLEHLTGITDGAPADALETFAATRTLALGLRVHRPVCGAEAQSVRLDLAVAASLPGLDTALVEELGPQPETLNLTPELAPIPEPSISFGGSLDFGSVPVDATGVKQAPAPASIAVTVSNLDRACGAWNVGLAAKRLGGEDGSTIAASTLHLVSVNDEAHPDGGCPLDGGCRIAVVQAGPGTAPTATFTLGVSLVLPDQPRATTFNSTLTATLAAVEP